MAEKMSSRERIIAVLDHREPDHIPLSFMLFNGLKSISQDYVDFIQRQVEMGLDVCVELPPRPPGVINDYYNLRGIPVSYHPSVVVNEWVERFPDEHEPIMVKEYKTPEGVLRTEVRQTDDWRWGDHVPFLDPIDIGWPVLNYICYIECIIGKPVLKPDQSIVNFGDSLGKEADADA